MDAVLQSSLRDQGGTVRVLFSKTLCKPPVTLDGSPSALLHKSYREERLELQQGYALFVDFEGEEVLGCIMYFKTVGTFMELAWLDSAVYVDRRIKMDFLAHVLKQKGLGGIEYAAIWAKAPPKDSDWVLTQHPPSRYAGTWEVRQESLMTTYDNYLEYAVQSGSILAFGDAGAVILHKVEGMHDFTIDLLPCFGDNHRITDEVKSAAEALATPGMEPGMEDLTKILGDSLYYDRDKDYVSDRVYLIKLVPTDSQPSEPVKEFSSIFSDVFNLRGLCQVRLD